MTLLRSDSSHRRLPVLAFCLVTFVIGRLALLPGTLAETVVLRPIADTTLFESSPADNMGGWTHVAAGTTGNSADRTKNRGLFRFDIAGALPSQSKITNATLALRVVRVPGSVGGGGPVSSTFTLRRVLKSWGEGDKLGDRGFPADPGEATWNFRFAPESNGSSGATWSVPGGAAGNDFSATISASRSVAGVGNYLFGPHTNLVADLQAWLDDPNSNFGWILMTQSEGTAKTARAFGSREDTNNPPVLTIGFTAPQRLRIDRIERVASEIQFQFSAEAGSAYTVQYRESLPSDAWVTLTNIVGPPVSTSILVRDAIAGNKRFYRVVKP